MSYYVYILSSIKGTCMSESPNNLEGRVLQHKTRAIEGFTKRYGIDLLVYYEEFDCIEDAVLREKANQGIPSRKETQTWGNDQPKWEGLSKGWFDDERDLIQK